jgi:hypothetical protein
MRERPIRPRIWKPVTKYGIIDTDRKYVVGFTLISFTVPFVFELSLFRVPLPLPAALAGLVSSTVFFRFIRQGRRPNWFHNRVQALREDFRYLFCRTVRRALPRDEERRGATPWVTDGEGDQVEAFLTSGELA